MPSPKPPKTRPRPRPKSDTSWENSSRWYDEVVGEDGSYYHQNVILPILVNQMSTASDSRILDLGCGQGILARQLKKFESYQGYDLSEALVGKARTASTDKRIQFAVQDCTRLEEKRQNYFTHAVMLLSLQNMEDPASALQKASEALAPGGRLFLVLNHPCFRIPRQSSWVIDEGTQERARKLRRYMNPLKIPITTHPGKGQKSSVTWSFHRPVSFYVQEMNRAGLLISDMQEWVSDKSSGKVGRTARMENLSRQEFPLFLFLEGTKLERKSQ